MRHLIIPLTYNNICQKITSYRRSRQLVIYAVRRVYYSKNDSS